MGKKGEKNILEEKEEWIDNEIKRIIQEKKKEKEKISTNEDKKLTEQQKMILKFIFLYIQENKIPPSYNDLAEITNMTRKAVYDHVERLCKKGYLKKIPYISRGIQLNVNSLEEVERIETIKSDRKVKNILNVNFINKAEK
jgi:Cdc6-like AAA superfamily ATPase